MKISESESPQSSHDLDAKFYVQQLGYPSQYHEIYTPNGYQLSLLRINSKQNNKIQNRNATEPLLFLHGFACDYNFFLGNYEQHSLPLQLADSGHDIWIANFRGTTNSLKHKNLTHNDAEYWDFDITDYAEDDLPTLIQYVGNLTNSKVNLFTSSLGGTNTLWALSTQNEIVEKYINKAILSGVGVFAETLEPFKPFNFFYIDTIISLFPYVPKTTLLKSFAKNFPTLANFLVKYFVEGGANYNFERLQYLSKAFPQNIPSKLIRHMIQMQKSKKFTRFDYGPEINLKKYGKQEPPIWQGQNIRKGQIHLLHGKRDALFPPQTLNYFTSLAPQADISVHILEQQGHCSFLLSNDFEIFNTINHILKQ